MKHTFEIAAEERRKQTAKAAERPDLASILLPKSETGSYLTPAQIETIIDGGKLKIESVARIELPKIAWRVGDTIRIIYDLKCEEG